MELIQRFFDPPHGSLFLFGPRGTGKSTFLRQAFPQGLYVDLLDVETFRAMVSRPERLRQQVEMQPPTTVVLLDEIQKVPQLLDVVHSLIEARRGYRFIMTGSSSRKLKQTGADLLGGRALLCWLHPFLAAEMGERFDLPSALQHGTLPVVVSSQDPTAVIQSYAALYVGEEVQQEGLVRNVGDFSRFLEVVSFSHGSQLNISNVARECEVSRKVVEGYVGILEDLYLGYRLPVFTRRAQRATAVHPKFYYFDAGLFRSLRPTGPMDRSGEIEGAALEGLVAQHLRAWVDYSGGHRRLYFWRTRAGSEVDFILYGDDTFSAIEVKNSDRVQASDLRALKTFTSDYPECRPCLIYRGREPLLVDGIPVLPCVDFLMRLRPGQPLMP